MIISLHIIAYHCTAWRIIAHLCRRARRAAVRGGLRVTVMAVAIATEYKYKKQEQEQTDAQEGDGLTPQDSAAR